MKKNEGDTHMQIDPDADKIGLTQAKDKKTNVTLALDNSLIQQLRSEAKGLDQSLNVRINAILRKHVKFYHMTELNGAGIFHPILVQFMIQEIDESKFIENWKKLGNSFVEGYFAQNKIPFTFENYVKYFIEELAIYSGQIKKVSRYVDEKDGKTCLFLLHSYDSKFSRIIGAAYSAQIERLLKVHTVVRIFPDGVEIKIVESGSR